MSELKEKKEKIEVIGHKVDSLRMLIRDISDEEIDELSMKELHEVDKHMFEILKTLEKF
ncbi:MAG: hypothetical protein ABJF11_00960 [Reichenbachiella sp.]|uniref:hypothetical protein n=1 Tax=Reichenbachiella sp. TaxID=2184521 RepID=UPI00326634D4